MADQLTPRRHKQITVLFGMVVLLCVCFSVATWMVLSSSRYPGGSVDLGTFNINGTNIVHRSTILTVVQPLEVTERYLSRGWQRGPHGILFSVSCLSDRLCITRAVASDPVSDQFNELSITQIIGIRRVR